MSINEPFYVLLAPVGQLCGNGQLRETISERRNRKGENVAFWYLSPELVQSLNISDLDVEAVVAKDQTAINWLQLRFGGSLKTMNLNPELLRNKAMDLPPQGTTRDISSSD